MLVAGVIEIWLGVSAEQESLEEVATPLSAEAVPDDEGHARESAAPQPRRLPGAYRRVYSPRASFATLPRDDRPLAEEIDEIVGALERSGRPAPAGARLAPGGPALGAGTVRPRPPERPAARPRRPCGRRPLRPAAGPLDPRVSNRRERVLRARRQQRRWQVLLWLLLLVLLVIAIGGGIVVSKFLFLVLLVVLLVAVIGGIGRRSTI